MPDIVHRYFGACSCGAVEVVLSLPKRLETYTPRRCDCDYCMAREGVYLSDPEGFLLLRTQTPLEEEKQGSGLATMLKCRECDDLVAATCMLEGHLRGAVRAPLLEDKALLQPPEQVSPQTLTKTEKSDRWAQKRLTVAISTDL